MTECIGDESIACTRSSLDDLIAFAHAHTSSVHVCASDGLPAEPV